MPLKTQIILVATLFLVFATLSGVARMRAAQRRRRRPRRRRSVDDVDPSVLSEADPTEAAMDPEEDPPRSARNQLVIIALAIALTVGAAVAVLLFSGDG